MFSFTESRTDNRKPSQRVLLGRSAASNIGYVQHPLLINPESMSVEVLPDVLPGDIEPRVFDVDRENVYWVAHGSGMKLHLMRLGFPELRSRSVLPGVAEGLAVRFAEATHIVGTQWWTVADSEPRVRNAATQVPWNFVRPRYSRPEVQKGNRIVGAEPCELSVVSRSSHYGLLVQTTSQVRGSTIYQVEFRNRAASMPNP